MPKQIGAVGLKGKIGDITFTNGRTGKGARKSAIFSEEQKEKARQRPQVVRTALLNNLAKSFKDVLKECNYNYVPKGFWPRVLKALRKEKSDHPVLLIRQFLDMELDLKRPFADVCPLPLTELNITAKKYSFNIDISQPATVSKDYNCYFLQFIMMVWNSDDKTVRYEEQETDWLNPIDRLPKFITMHFKRTAADTEWLLACRMVQGCNNVETGYVTDCRIRIIEGGTVSKESMKILEERAVENELKKKERVKKKEMKVKKKVAVRRER